VCAESVAPLHTISHSQLLATAGLQPKTASADAGSCPDSACLVTDDNDSLLLCLHSSQAGRTTALRLLLDDVGPKIQVQSPHPSLP